jgi:branched-chain amino acid transport system substrate-binding protein
MKKSLLITALASILVAGYGCNGGSSTTGETTTTGTEPGTTSGSTPPAGSRPVSTAAGNTATGDTIKVGLVASLNGDLKPWGADCEQGAKLAVEEFNAAGGVNGKKVELLIQDSQSTPEKGKTAAEKLISDGAVGLIGEVASGITAQMAQSAFEKGVPVMAVGATRTDLSKIGSNVFRVCYVDDFQGPVVAKFAYEELGLRNVALLTDVKQPYSVGLSDSFRAYFEKLGGKVVDEQKYESAQTQFSSQLTAIKGKNPDGLILTGYFNEVGPIIRQANEMGLKGPYLGGDGWDSREIITNAGEAIKNGFFCNHYNNDEDRPEVKKFLETWKAKYGSLPATTMGALGYDATMVTLNGLKNAKELNSKSLIEALENTENFPGVSGSITLKGKNGNPPKRALMVGLDPVGMKQVFKKAYEYFEAN